MKYLFDDNNEREYDNSDGIVMTRGERFFKVWDFMVGDFHLEKTELLVYAIIFGMYRNYCDAFTGSREYLAKWTNASKRSVAEALKSLEGKKLIEKEYRQYGQIKRAVYHVNTLILPTCEMFNLENIHRDVNDKERQKRRRKELGFAPIEDTD